MSRESGERAREDAFVTVGPVEDVPLGTGRAFPVGDRMVAVFHLEDGFFALADACPHMGASLAEGHVEGGCVTCPWHGWRFGIRDGAWADYPKVSTDTFEVRVRDGTIQVRVTPNDATEKDARPAEDG